MAEDIEERQKEDYERQIASLKKLCEEQGIKLLKTKNILRAVSSIINEDMDVLSKKINEEIKKL